MIMFKKKQSLGLRVWHWSNALLISLLFLTVFLRKTFLSVKANTNAIMMKAQEVGGTLTESQANDIARMLRKAMWQWHPIIGLAVVALLLYRAYLYFTDKKNAKISMEGKPLLYKVVKRNYILFYTLLTVMGITGMLLYWDDSLAIDKSTHNFIKEVHEFLMWYFPAFVIAHIAGVVYADRGEDRGLISDMINGGDQ
jgi:Ni/Fe-hydrogenase 1 B-type cytochrome subunit